MIIVLYSFGEFDLNQIMKDLQGNHSNHKFKIAGEIKTSPNFRTGFFRKQPIFNAELVLAKLLENKPKHEARYIFTKHILVESKSITSSLYGGLCYTDDKVLIMSTARLPNYATILTVANHELGHLFGLDHCQGHNCLMAEGMHGQDVSASTYWCKECLSQL